MNVVIENGKLTTDQGEEVFTIQDNAKVPKAQDPASGDNGNNNGGKDNTYDDNIGSGAFFPKSCSGKSISAWYAHSGSESDEGYEMKYVAAIYFFVDGSFVGTSNVAVSGPTGQSFERTVGAEGSYRIVEGNFNTGKVAITYDKDKTVILEIENGQLKAIDTEDGSVTIYIKQDNTKVPGPSDPTNNGNQGGQGGDPGQPPEVQARPGKQYLAPTPDNGREGQQPRNEAEKTEVSGRRREAEKDHHGDFQNETDCAVEHPRRIGSPLLDRAGRLACQPGNGQPDEDRQG
jgi:hypothetical protein